MTPPRGLRQFLFADLPWGATEREVELALFRLGFLEDGRQDHDDRDGPPELAQEFTREITFLGHLDGELVEVACNFQRAHTQDPARFALHSVCITLRNSSKTCQQIADWFRDLVTARYGPPGRISASPFPDDRKRIESLMWGEENDGDDCISIFHLLEAFQSDGRIYSGHGTVSLTFERRQKAETLEWLI